MKLYVTHLGRWAGTQTDAKALGKEDGGWVEQEVPTDKTSLIAFLNEWTVAEAPDDDISDLLGDDDPAVEEILSAKVVTTAPVIDTYMIVDWLLDTATPTQVEVVFGALGARFHEANKGKNND